MIDAARRRCRIGRRRAARGKTAGTVLARVVRTATCPSANLRRLASAIGEIAVGGRSVVRFVVDEFRQAQLWTADLHFDWGHVELGDP